MEDGSEWSSSFLVREKAVKTEGKNLYSESGVCCFVELVA